MTDIRERLEDVHSHMEDPGYETIIKSYRDTLLFIFAGESGGMIVQFTYQEVGEIFYQLGDLLT